MRKWVYVVLIIVGTIIFLLPTLLPNESLTKVIVGFLDQLNKYANLILVIVTTVYVVYTAYMVQEMKATREPAVFIDFEMPDEEIRITIGNSGQSPARNIEFEYTDNIPWLDKELGHAGLAGIQAINAGISYLAPSRVLKYAIGHILWSELVAANALLEIRVKYKNETGQPFNREYVIDFEQYKGILFESFRDSNIAVADAIRDAERSRISREQTNGYTKLMGEGPKKTCPICAEVIPKAAKKCSHCGEYLDVNNVPTQSTQTLNSRFAVGRVSPRATWWQILKSTLQLRK
jgi:hypothetical protein